MEENTLKISIDYRGHHWKGIPIYNDTQVNLKNKNLYFNEQNIAKSFKQ
jgi:hypothetical protein